jgi:hypothetical protein
VDEPDLVRVAHDRIAAVEHRRGRSVDRDDRKAAFDERGLWNIRPRTASFRLGTRELDYLGPFLGIFSHEPSEVSRRSRERRCA